jgi:hypothetical protein
MNSRKRILLPTLALIGLILSTSCSPSKTPTIITNSLPEGVEDVAYSHTLEVQGGSPPYIWSVSGGKLPIGLQLNPTSGVISGTPMIATNPAFVTFMVTDNSKKIAFKQILMTVNPVTTTTTTFSTITTSTTTNSETVNSINGLSLTLFLDGTVFKPGQNVSLSIDEHNTLTTENIVTPANDWAYNGLAIGGCGTNGGFDGIAVMRGYYTAADKPLGGSLAFWNYSITTPCPVDIPPPNGFDFAPLDNKYAGVDLDGYWADDDGKATLTNFEPGDYTVIAGDEWGALVFVHFTVAN